MRIGILGGTFDPIHIAHTYMAEETINKLKLDKVIILPNGDPPHKDNNISKSEDRYNMAVLATRGKDKIEVSDLEIKIEKPSYTYRTLEILKKDKYINDDLFFIIGRDSLVTFKSWYKPQEILKYATLVCFDRPGYREEEVRIAKDFIESLGGKLIVIDSLELEISSTDIRNRFKNGNEISSFLDKDVYEYIKKMGLYR